jgi:ribose transport system substrate-binding protein
MKDMIQRTRDRDETVPANDTNRPSIISAAIEMTAVGLTSNAPLSGTFTAGPVLVTEVNVEQYYCPDSLF